MLRLFQGGLTGIQRGVMQLAIAAAGRGLIGLHVMIWHSSTQSEILEGVIDLSAIMYRTNSCPPIL